MDAATLNLILFVAAYVGVMGGTSVFLGRNKQRTFLMRFLLGLFLGPIGWLIAWLMKPPLSPEEAQALQQKFELEQAEWKGENG